MINFDDLTKRSIAQDKVSNYTRDKDDEFQSQIKEFVENAPLYSRKQIVLPPLKKQFRVDVAFLPCNICKATHPFRKPERYGMIFPSGGSGKITEEDYLQYDVYPVNLQCTGCNKAPFYCYIWIDPSNQIAMKVGQFPMWLPKIPKDISDELGEDAILYLKALRNMNESYGIGACAYFRRLVETYINPLLELLYEIKQEEGANPDELQEIKDVIQAKEFARKMEVAIKITPKSIEVKGMNPIKKLHELLSIGLHNLEDNEAMEVATQISGTLQYVIRQLRRQHEEKKSFIESMKVIGKIKTDKD